MVRARIDARVIFENGNQGEHNLVKTENQVKQT